MTRPFVNFAMVLTVVGVCGVASASERTYTGMSYNVRVGLGDERQGWYTLPEGHLGYLPQCARVIREVRPDWVAIEEIDNGPERTGKVDQTAVLAKLTGMRGVFRAKIPHTGGEYGVAMLVREEPVSVRKLELGGPPKDHKRILVAVELTNMIVCATHFSLDGARRLEAVEKIKSAFAGSEKPVFIGGDFNMEPDSQEFKNLATAFKPLSDVTMPTWPSHEPREILDFIFVDRAHADRVKVKAVEYPTIDLVATDHRPVVVRYSFKSAEPRPERLIDTCWMWGHETYQVDGTNNEWKLDVAAKYYPMTEGAKSFGIDSLNIVRWDRPDRAFRDTLKPMRRVTWPVSGIAHWGSVGYDELADWCFKVADESPNVSGFDLDDFFTPDGKTQLVVETPTGPRKSCPTRFSYEKLRKLRQRMNRYARPLELRLVTYDGLLEECVDPHDLQPSFELADTLTYWTWKAENLDKLPQNLARVKALAPGKRIDLGIYLYDFGGRREMPAERMELQLRLGLDLWKRGEIDGFVFLCSSICNRDFAAVRLAREWLRRHGSETRKMAR